MTDKADGFVIKTFDPPLSVSKGTIASVDTAVLHKPFDEVISIEHNVQFTEEPPKRTWLRRLKDRLIG